MNKIAILISGIAIGVIIMFVANTIRINKIDSIDTMYKIRITTEFINVRTQPTTNAKKIFEVNNNETYKVIEVFNDDKNYTWYKIIFSDRRTGWVASDKEEPYVKEEK